MTVREQNTVERSRISTGGIVPGVKEQLSTNTSNNKTLACVSEYMGADWFNQIWVKMFL